MIKERLLAAKTLALVAAYQGHGDVAKAARAGGLQAERCRANGLGVAEQASCQAGARDKRRG